MSQRTSSCSAPSKVLQCYEGLHLYPIRKFYKHWSHRVVGRLRPPSTSSPGGSPASRHGYIMRSLFKWIGMSTINQSSVSFLFRYFAISEKSDTKSFLYWFRYILTWNLNALMFMAGECIKKQRLYEVKTKAKSETIGFILMLSF
jgi:hypothetical protein